MSPAPDTGFGGFLALPVHPAFVHFPVALLTLAWLITVLSYITGSSTWIQFGRRAEWIGVAFLPITGLAGFRDAKWLAVFTDARWDQPLIWHVIVSTAAAAVFTAHAIWLWRVPDGGRTSDSFIVRNLAMTTLGFWLLVMTGLIAGEMVYG